MVALARPDSLGNWALTGSPHMPFTWDVIGGYLFLPWHLERIRGEPKNDQEKRTFQASDAALRFWMYPDPIFLPPLGHEEFGLPDLTQSDISQVTVVLAQGRTETYEVRRDLTADRQ